MHRDQIELSLYRPNLKVDWYCSSSLVPYEEALHLMQQRAENIAYGKAPEAVWLLEHPPLYTAGTSAREEDLLKPVLFPVYNAGRGGQYTYHGPGQRIIYILLNLKKRYPDIRAFVAHLEQWVINSLADFNIEAERREDRIGVWVKTSSGEEKKIAAIGIRVRKWVSYHGIAINIDPNLEHYKGIIPCGIKDYGVTSMKDLGKVISMPIFDVSLEKNFLSLFGPIIKKNEPFT